MKNHLFSLVSLLIGLSLGACGGGPGGSTGGSTGSQGTVAGYVFSYQNPGAGYPGELFSSPEYFTGIIGSESVVATYGSTVSDTSTMASVSVSGSEYIFIGTENGNILNSYIVTGSGISAQLLSTLSNVCSTGGVVSLAVLPGGNVLYAGCGNGDIYQVSVNSGYLTKGSVVSTSGTAVLAMAINTATGYLLVNTYESPTSSYYYAFSIGSGGALTPYANISGVSGDTRHMVGNPNTANGNFFYAGSAGNGYLLSVGSGSITATPISGNSGYPNLYPVFVDAAGSYFYMVESDNNNTEFNRYSIGPSGGLTYAGAISLPTYLSGKGVTSDISTGIFETNTSTLVENFNGYTCLFTISANGVSMVGNGGTTGLGLGYLGL